MLRRAADPAIAILLGAVAFALYTLTLAPTVLAGDAGEFQFVPYLLGVAHPTGYPLYCLFGWLWSHLLPVGDVAYRMNLFSALWAALAVGLLYPLVMTLLQLVLPGLSAAARRTIAALAASTFAVTPTFWSQAIIAEVYGLHLFFVVALLWLILRWAVRRSPRLLLAAAGLFGLSLAHHRTTLLLAPALLAFAWMNRSRAGQEGIGRFSRFAAFWEPVWRKRKRLGIGLILFLLPLALYLYIPLRAPYTPYLHLPLAPGQTLGLYQNGFDGFLEFILGGPFGGSVDLTVDLGERAAMTGELWRQEFGWAGLALALLGLIGLAIGRRSRPGSAGAARHPGRGGGGDSKGAFTLTALAFVATVSFNLVYTIGDIFVLFIPAYLVIVLWLAVGVGLLADLPCLRPALSTLLILPFFALPLWLALTHYAEIDQSRNTQARTAWEAILTEPLPPGSVLISNDRNEIMPMWYLQYVGNGQRYRPDLLGLFPQITVELPTLGPVLDLALSTERPTFLIKEMPGIEVLVAVEQEGSLWRVAGPAVEGEPAYPSGARLAQVLTLIGYDLSPRDPQPGQPLQVSLTWEALSPLENTYHTFVHLVAENGTKLTQSDRQPGGIYYPSTLWQPGTRLRDQHLLSIPAGALPGDYQLLAGAYAFAKDGTLEPLGEPVPLGRVAIRAGRQMEPAAVAQIFLRCPAPAGQGRDRHGCRAINRLSRAAALPAAGN